MISIRSKVIGKAVTTLQASGEKSTSTVHVQKQPLPVATAIQYCCTE
jgi:hypothetical protein